MRVWCVGASPLHTVHDVLISVTCVVPRRATSNALKVRQAALLGGWGQKRKMAGTFLLNGVGSRRRGEARPNVTPKHTELQKSSLTSLLLTRFASGGELPSPQPHGT
jgi:hypothetical protein